MCATNNASYNFVSNFVSEQVGGAGQYRLDLDARAGLPYESEQISSWIHISPKDSLPHLNQKARP